MKLGTYINYSLEKETSILDNRGSFSPLKWKIQDILLFQRGPCLAGLQCFIIIINVHNFILFNILKLYAL